MSKGLGAWRLGKEERPIRNPLRFVIPNAVTALSLLFACASIVQASRGQFEAAAWLIVWCALLDIADGKLAALLDARSRFGVQFDSLADLLAFCVAPSLLVYFVLTTDPRFAPIFQSGALSIALAGATGAYLLCGALRLARYNVQRDITGYDRFHGLPCTIAGVIVSTFMLAAWRWQLPPECVLASPVLLLLCGLLMISNLPLPRSLGAGRAPLWLRLTGLALVYSLGVTQSLPSMLLLLAVAYAALGFVLGQSTRQQSQELT